MDFGRLLADPIMEDTVVKQLFFSSRRYERFSLHTVRCDASAIRLNIAFFHVFWFPTYVIPIRPGAFFGRQIGSPKREPSKTFQNVQREKTHAKSQHTAEFGKKTAQIGGRVVHKNWSFQKLCQVREIVPNRNKTLRFFARKK